MYMYSKATVLDDDTLAMFSSPQGNNHAIVNCRIVYNSAFCQQMNKVMKRTRTYRTYESGDMRSDPGENSESV